MDFSLNEQQEMMQALAKDFLAAEYTDKVLKAAVKDERGFTPELWKKLAEANLTGLSLPEQYGGVGDFLDLTVVLEEMGRVCFLSPFFATVVLGASAIMAAGNDEQKRQYLTDIAAGKIIMTLALAETKADYSPADVLAKAEGQGAGYILNGAKLFVPDAQSADYIICAARTKMGLKPEDGITLFIVDAKNEGLHIMPLKTAAGDKQSEVTLHNVYVLPENILGPVDGAWPLIEKILQRANTARCAEMVGLAQQALKMTLDYAKERIAFGHPIGAFQGIQHRCADMLIDIEGSGFATYQAAWRLNEGLDAAKEVAVAKAWVSQACKRVMASAHQVHGAIGFTEDHMLHYYTKRARAYEFSFGGADAQLEKLAELYWK